MIFQYVLVWIILIVAIVITIKNIYKRPYSGCSVCKYICPIKEINLKKEEKMKNLFLKEEKLTLNKSFCIQLYFSEISYFGLKGSFKLFTDDYYFKFGLSFLGDIFTLSTYWNRRMDHAGFTFDLTILGVSFHFNIYDNRHWDYQENNWKNTYIEE